MIAYIDSSALAKRYISEEGSGAIHSIFEETDYMETSAITELEITGLFERAKREHSLDSPTHRKVMHYFQGDIYNGTLSLVHPSAESWKLAKRLIQQRRLRVLDAIQLATAIASNKRLGGDVDFICSDEQLLEAAKLEGLRCVNPCRR